MPTKRAAAKPAKPKKVEKPKLTAKKPAAKPVAAKTSAKPAPAKAPPPRSPFAEGSAGAGRETRAAASATPVAQAIRKARALGTHRRDRDGRVVLAEPASPPARAPPRPTNDGDDDDAGSLLAGPRNVRRTSPSVARRT